MPGMRKSSTVRLMRSCFEGDIEFYSWRDSIQLSSVERRNITISLLNESHEPIIVWKIKNAWPISRKFGDLNAMKSDIFIES